jgi:replicative DNA helicase
MDTLQLTTEIIDGKPQVELMLIPKKNKKERTAATITVAKIALEHGIPMAIFSMELSNTRLVAHLLADSSEPDVVESLEAKLANGQLQQTLDAIKDKPLYLDDSPTLSVSELREKAGKLVKEHGVELVLVDYLEMMEPCKTEDLSAIAKELGILFIVLSQKSNTKR